LQGNDENAYYSLGSNEQISYKSHLKIKIWLCICLWLVAVTWVTKNLVLAE